MHKARHTAGQRVLDATGNLKAAQKLLGHASIQTTADIYTDWGIEQLAEKMRQVGRRVIVPHGKCHLQGLWRRRESNPRPRTHRPSVYKLRPRLEFRPDGWFATNPPAGLAILWSRAAGDWLSLGASPSVDAGSQATGRAWGDTLH